MQNSQENTCARVSFFSKVTGWGLQFCWKKRLWHRCFAVNFAKFLRTSFLQNTFGLLLLIRNRRLLNISLSLVNTNYFPVIWMLHGRSSYYKLNKLRQRCLHDVHNDRKSSFSELLENDRYISIHKYACSVYKLINGSSPKTIKWVFSITLDKSL